MKLTILAASGATGLELTRQALRRGHAVTAIARTPARIAVPDSPLLTRVAADVRDHRSIAADAEILKHGGTLFHAGLLSNGSLSAERRTVGLDNAPRRFFPARVSRATVAAAMLDEAEDPAHLNAVAIPLER